MKPAVLALTLSASLWGAALAASPAHALCIYNDAFNVETTLAQEFADSPLVVRARVVGVDTHWSNDDGLDYWILYRLEVIETFKGTPPRRIEFFTTRDSGGFYLDGQDGSLNDATNDWLLFLQPSNHDLAPPGAMFVNYNCGRSGRWGELSDADRSAVRSLAGPGLT